MEREREAATPTTRGQRERNHVARAINLICYSTNSSNLSTVEFHSSENGCLQFVRVRSLIACLGIPEGSVEAAGGGRRWWQQLPAASAVLVLNDYL